MYLWLQRNSLRVVLQLHVFASFPFDNSGPDLLCFSIQILQPRPLVFHEQLCSVSLRNALYGS